MPSRPTLRWPLVFLLAPILLLGAHILPWHDSALVFAARSSPARMNTLPASCPTGPVVAQDGIRRLALIVGVGSYQAPSIDTLLGPPNDAARMFTLLTGPGGYGFPAQNVCTLINEQATLATFRKAFDQALVKRAHPGDVVVIYFSGHGTQEPDLNGDEPDGWDETLLLHDSKLDAHHPPLIDDEWNTMLSQVSEKTRHVVVIMDSCNSGTAMRGGMAVARFVPPDTTRPPQTNKPAAADGTEDSASSVSPRPGLVVLSAAADGTSAIEAYGEGFFTSALLQVLSAAGPFPLTYAQMAARVRPLVASMAAQTPYFQGALDDVVFGNRTRQRPIGWEVTGVEGDGNITLHGVPLPGWSEGALVRVYDGSASLAQLADPRQSSALLKLTARSGLTATAVRLDSEMPGKKPIQLGDQVTLVQPGLDALQLKVRLRPESEPGGLPSLRRRALQAAIRDLQPAVLEVETDAFFELWVGPDNRLYLSGIDGRIRNQFGADASREDSEVVGVLRKHAMQQSLLQLRAEPGATFINNETLQVRLVPHRVQLECARGRWVPAPPNQEQVLPLCHQYQVEVTVSKQAQSPLLVGGVLLSDDGTISGIPTDGIFVKLSPGQTATLEGEFRAEPPINVREHLLIFGTQEPDPVEWRRFSTSGEVSRGHAAGVQEERPLEALVQRFIGQQRGALAWTGAEPGMEAWTSTYLSLVTEANTQFLNAGKDIPGELLKREYSVSSLDIRAYLPSDPESALYKVLTKADELASYAAGGKVGYKMHPWTQPTDAENLQLGITCSRAIWWVFTRAGLPFNHDNEIVRSRDAVGADSIMREEFEDCRMDPHLHTGDVLVYRDPARNLGHMVMVIDPRKRIAWGAHTWDGNATAQPPGRRAVNPTAVQYQVIQNRSEWSTWDYPGLRRAGCWRYRGFSKQADDARDVPGRAALTGVCGCKEAPARPN